MQIIGGFETWTKGAGFDLRDKRVLEIGPGVNLAGSIGLKALGAAEVIASDRWIPLWQDEYSPLFCRIMAQRVRAERPLWEAEPFEQAGFQVSYQISEVATEPYLEDFLRQLRRSRSRYRDMDERLLKAIGGFFVVRKPGALS